MLLHASGFCREEREAALRPLRGRFGLTSNPGGVTTDTSRQNQSSPGLPPGMTPGTPRSAAHGRWPLLYPYTGGSRPRAEINRTPLVGDLDTGEALAGHDLPPHGVRVHLPGLTLSPQTILTDAHEDACPLLVGHVHPAICVR